MTNLWTPGEAGNGAETRAFTTPLRGSIGVSIRGLGDAWGCSRIALYVGKRKKGAAIAGRAFVALGDKSVEQVEPGRVGLGGVVSPDGIDAGGGIRVVPVGGVQHRHVIDHRRIEGQRGVVVGDE